MRQPLLTSALAVVVLALPGCAKKPSPAAVAADQWATLAAQSRYDELMGRTVDGTRPVTSRTGGEVQEGSYGVCNEQAMGGVLDRVATKVTAEQKLPTGDVRLDLFVDICTRPEGAGGCSRPNVYAMKLLLRPDGAGFKVAGSTCGDHALVR